MGSAGSDFAQFDQGGHRFGGWQVCRHWGVDWKAIGTAIDQAGDHGPRGASTISMQTVKNLFLWNSRSYVRKALEIPLTYATELVSSKSRILEIYLNIAEWGPGVYGAEAAGRYHFSKSAARLSGRRGGAAGGSAARSARPRCGQPRPHHGPRGLAGAPLDGRKPAVRCVLPPSRDVKNPNVGRPRERF